MAVKGGWSRLVGRRVVERWLVVVWLLPWLLLVDVIMYMLLLLFCLLLQTIEVHSCLSVIVFLLFSSQVYFIKTNDFGLLVIDFIFQL